MKDCAVLFSGGIDSTTALYWALRKFKSVNALTFDYGQRHRIEVDMARRAAARLGVSQTILKLDLGQIGGSALTDIRIRLPGYRTAAEIKSGPVATYVPFRNGIFLALAAAWSEVHGIHRIVCGFNVIDSPDYPDTRSSFVRAMERAINSGSKAALGEARIRILAPLIRMRKSEIIRLGLSLGADYSYSVSCYAGRERPCGRCSACFLRRRAFAEAGVEDPLIQRLKKGGK
jgi:7-cyano-7-deazaguanine synthase